MEPDLRQALERWLTHEAPNVQVAYAMPQEGRYELAVVSRDEFAA